MAVAVESRSLPAPWRAPQRCSRSWEEAEADRAAVEAGTQPQAWGAKDSRHCAAAAVGSYLIPWFVQPRCHDCWPWNTSQRLPGPFRRGLTELDRLFLSAQEGNSTKSSHWRWSLLIVISPKRAGKVKRGSVVREGAGIPGLLPSSPREAQFCLAFRAHRESMLDKYPILEDTQLLIEYGAQKAPRFSSAKGQDPPPSLGARAICESEQNDTRSSLYRKGGVGPRLRLPSARKVQPPWSCSSHRLLIPGRAASREVPHHVAYVGVVLVGWRIDGGQHVFSWAGIPRTLDVLLGQAVRLI